MLFHLQYEQRQLRIRTIVEGSVWFFKKRVDQKLPNYRDTMVTIQNHALVGKMWINDMVFPEPIEECYIGKDMIQVLLRGSLQVQQIWRNQTEFIKVRKSPDHRVSLHGAKIVNYQDGTINAQADPRVNRRNHYLADANCFIEGDEIKEWDLQIRPLIEYKRCECRQLTDETVLVTLIGAERLNILLKRKQQIDFYPECSYLLGQLSYLKGYFFLIDEGQLMQIGPAGVLYQETIHENSIICEEKIYSIKGVNVEENKIKEQNTRFEISVQYSVAPITLLGKAEKYKLLLNENPVPKEFLVEYLIETQDLKYIKRRLPHLLATKAITDKKDLASIYFQMDLLKQSLKRKALFKLLQCYEPSDLSKVSFIDCIRSESFNPLHFIQVFQKQLIFNYAHTLIHILNHHSADVGYFLPTGQLFNDFLPKEEGRLASKDMLQDLKFLGREDIPAIAANYQQIATQVLGQIFGLYRFVSTFTNNLEIFLYNVCVENCKTRYTFAEFEKLPNQLETAIVQAPDAQCVLQKISEFYSREGLNLLNELVKLLRRSKNPLQIFEFILEKLDSEIVEDETIKNAIMELYEIVKSHTSENYAFYVQTANLIRQCKWKISQQNQDEILQIIFDIEQVAQISVTLAQFNVYYKFASIFQQLKDQPLKLLDQALENYFIGRVKSMSFKFQEQSLNLALIQDLRLLFKQQFKNFFRDPSQIDMLIFRKFLEFGKYRESKQICSTFQLKPEQFDEVISKTMKRYLELQKKADLLEEERKKFQEVIVEAQKVAGKELPETKKVRSLYKFIHEVKEHGSYQFRDLKKCNQAIFSIYKRTQNLDLPYIRMKKKLARANDVEIYDQDFCRFMLDLAQKNMQSNPAKTQLILDDLNKNGDSVIQSEVSIFMLSTSKDEAQRQEHYWRILKSTQSADAVRTLMRNYQPKTPLQLHPKEIEILKLDIVAVPISTKSDKIKFQQKYSRLYLSEDLLEIVFLDQVLIDPKLAFWLLMKKKYQSHFELVQRLCMSELLNIEVLLTFYLRSLTDEQNEEKLLQSDGVISQAAEALALGRYKQLFSRQALFDKVQRKQEILELMKNVDVENIMPALKFFKDLDLHDMKIRLFVNQLKSYDLNDYYLNGKQERVKSWVNNQINLNPGLMEVDIDCRYHWIIYEDQAKDLSKKEKMLITSLVNQSILSEQLELWDRIYRNLISKAKDYGRVKHDFEQVIDTQNSLILQEIVKHFFNEQESLMRCYFQKLIDRNEERTIEKWKNECGDQNLSALIKSML